jgi:hypothetical protein
MAVIKTKTKFTKSKFTKNKYSTKKKNVSRMTKKKNVMKGGSGKSVKPFGRRSESRRGRTHTFPPPSRDTPQYLKIFPNTSFPKKFSNSKSIEEYFLGEGEKLNTGTRSARINIGKLQEQLEKTNNPEKIIFNTLSGKYEQDFVEKVAKNTNMLKKILEAAKKKKEYGGLYMELGSPPPPRKYSTQMKAFKAQGYNPLTGYKKGINYSKNPII